MTKNKRQFSRKKLQIEVALNYLENSSHSAITRNISPGGMFIQLNNPGHYPMGEMVNLSYKNPLHNDEETFKDCIIVRQTDDGIGVAFIEIDEL